MTGSPFVARIRSRHHGGVDRSLVRAVIPLAVASIAMAGCWFQPGWGSNRSGHNPFERGLIRSNVATLTEAWTATSGEAGAVLDPVVSIGNVHAVSGRLLSDYRLDDGGRQWSVRVLPPGCPDDCDDSFEKGAPVLRNGQVYVPTMALSPIDATHIFDAATGERAGQVGPGGWSLSVDDDTLAIAGAERGNAPIQTFNVIDLVDPSRSWSDEPGVIAASSATATFGGDRVFFLSFNDLLAYDRIPAEDCTFRRCPPQWYLPLGERATPVVVSGDGRTVYVGNSRGHLLALDAADGSVRWSAQLGPPGTTPLSAAPTLGEGWLYVTSSDGRVLAFDAAGCGADTCEPLWGAATGSPITKQPALAGGVLYVASDDGSVQAYDAAGCGVIICVPLWRTATGSRITGGPAVAYGHLVVGTEDGRLIAYRPS